MKTEPSQLEVAEGIPKRSVSNKQGFGLPISSMGRTVYVPTFKKTMQNPTIHVGTYVPYQVIQALTFLSF